MRGGANGAVAHPHAPRLNRCHRQQRSLRTPDAVRKLPQWLAWLFERASGCSLSSPDRTGRASIRMERGAWLFRAKRGRVAGGTRTRVLPTENFYYAALLVAKEAEKHELLKAATAEALKQNSVTPKTTSSLAGVFPVHPARRGPNATVRPGPAFTAATSSPSYACATARPAVLFATAFEWCAASCQAVLLIHRYP